MKCDVLNEISIFAIYGELNDRRARRVEVRVCASHYIVTVEKSREEDR